MDGKNKRNKLEFIKEIRKRGGGGGGGGGGVTYHILIMLTLNYHYKYNKWFDNSKIII